MKKNRFYFLVREYHLVLERLNQARAAHIHAQVNLEIAKKLKREFDDEIRKAKDSKDAVKEKQWQEIMDREFKGDSDLTPEELCQKIEKEFHAKEKLITYYEKKALVIRSLLGARSIELIESFEEKSIMMGAHEAGSSQGLAEEEEKPKDEGDGFVFGKM